MKTLRPKINEIRAQGETSVIIIPRRSSIPLEVLIDTAVVPMLEASGFRWHAFQSTGNLWRVTARLMINGKRKSVVLARFLMDEPPGLDVDHINRNTLDNRMVNLRVVTRFGNNQNHSGNVNSTGFRGVAYGPQRRGRNKFQARIWENGKTITLGLYATAAEAGAVAEAATAARRGYSPLDLRDHLTPKEA